MAYAHVHTPVSRPSTGINTALWTVQVLVGLLFAAAGAMKLLQPTSDLAVSLPWVATVSPALVRFYRDL